LPLDTFPRGVSLSTAMVNRIALSALLPATILCAGLSAQTYHVAPSGHDVTEGTTNNTIPFWSVSATYQQIHDAADLNTVFGGPVAVINSINFRKDGTLSGGTPAKAFELEISMGMTSVSPLAYSTTFATNIGATPQVVLPYTPLNLPALTNSSVPNPMGWQIPFATPFTYISAAGNLCWEFRLKNGASGTAAMDASSRTGSIVYPNLGTGCIATGQTSAAAIGTKSLSMSTGVWSNRLDRAEANAPTVQLIGLGPVTGPFPLPGFCTDLQFLPMASVTGVASATGQWTSALTFGSLLDAPSIEIQAQFAWIDSALPNNVGLSNATNLGIPLDSIRSVCRVYLSPSGGAAGNELGLTATGGSSRYGLVTIFGQ
jgi:hypothetical protein